MKYRTRVLFEDNNQDEGPEWVVVFSFTNSEFDDDLEDNSTEEISINAVDFETAVKYAQQYLRKMKTEDESSEKWADAEIISVEMR